MAYQFYNYAEPLTQVLDQQQPETVALMSYNGYHYIFIGRRLRQLYLKIELDTPTIERTMPTKFAWRKINAGTACRLQTQ